MKPVVIYRRVSTSEQGKSGLGLEAQASAITRFCTAENFEVVDGFDDVGSGKLGLEGRPGLAAALGAAAAALGAAAFTAAGFLAATV